MTQIYSSHAESTPVGLEGKFAFQKKEETRLRIALSNSEREF